jgi:uncharacterized protein YbjT (DUF2867 family)
MKSRQLSGGMAATLPLVALVPIRAGQSERTDVNKAEKTILVAGATGQQGGAVARHLLAAGWPVRALTRDSDGPAARALADQGASVVQGDLADRSSLERALEGAYGVYSVQVFWPPSVGVEGEVLHGKSLADAAKAAGVKHFVYSSVGSAERNTGVAHFESKWQIEQHIRAVGLPATILRPVFFMENFNFPNFRQPILEGTLNWELRPDTRLALIAVDDIGAFAALALEKPEEFIGQAIEIGGDELTPPEVAEHFSEAIGRPVRFVEQSLDQVRSFDSEMAAMLQWFIDEGFQIDIPALRAMHPKLLTFEAWLTKAGWGSAPVTVR